MTQIDDRLQVGARLRQARESLGLTLADAARTLEVEAEQLSQWEAGASAPDDETLWSVAEAYGRPTAYFFSDSPPAPSRQDFRTSKALRDDDVRRVAVAEFEELCRAQATLRGRHGDLKEPKLEFLRERTRGLEDPESLAQEVRRLAKLGTEPIESIRDLLENLGVSVFLVNVPGPELSGTSWWHPAYGPAALINRSEGAGRRNFTMAHEMAHLLRLDTQPLCDLNEENADERFANRFAAAFLMPREHIFALAKPFADTGELGSWDTERTTIAKIAGKCATSVEATSFRLEELGLLPAGYTQSKRSELQRDYFRGTKGKRWRKAVKDLGSEYTASVREAYERGEMSLAAVADLLRIDVEQASEWLEDRTSES